MNRFSNFQTFSTYLLAVRIDLQIPLHHSWMPATGLIRTAVRSSIVVCVVWCLFAATNGLVVI